MLHRLLTQYRKPQSHVGRQGDLSHENNPALICYIVNCSLKPEA